MIHKFNIFHLFNNYNWFSHLCAVQSPGMTVVKRKTRVTSSCFENRGNKIMFNTVEGVYYNRVNLVKFCNAEKLPYKPDFHPILWYWKREQMYVIKMQERNKWQPQKEKKREREREREKGKTDSSVKLVNLRKADMFPILGLFPMKILSSKVQRNRSKSMKTNSAVMDPPVIVNSLVVGSCAQTMTPLAPQLSQR